MAFKNIILWIIKISLFAAPFIPLFIAKGLFFPFITGKAFIFRIIVEIIFFAWLYLVIFYKEYRPHKNLLLIAVGLFILIVALATIFGVNPTRSFWSNFERMEGLVTYLHLFAYFLVLGNVFQKKDWMIFLNLFVVSGLFEDIYALLQKLGYIVSPQSGFRPDGTIGNAAYLAAYLIFILGFCLLLLFYSKNKAAKVFYGFAGLFTAMVIYFTASRGPILAILAGAVLAGVLYLFFKKAESEKGKKYKKIFLISVGVLLVMAGIIWFLKDSKFVKNSEVLSRLTSLSFSERTITSRFTIWGMSWQGFKERPILGWGPDNYEVVFSKYYQPELWLQEPWFDRSHNIVFDWLINAGLLGLLAYLSIFFSALYLLWKNYLKKILSIEITILITVLFAVYFLQNLFIFDNLATYMSFFAILAFIYSVSIAGKKQEPADNKAVSNAKFLLASLLVPVFALAIYFINIKSIFSNYYLLQALRDQRQGQSVAVIFDDFKRFLAFSAPLGRQEARELLSNFGSLVVSSGQIGPAFKSEVARRTIEEGKKSVEENILNPRPYLFLGNVYKAAGIEDEALRFFNKALELSPKKQQIYFEIADVYVQKQDYKNAIPILEKALSLDPQFPHARLNLAANYIANGEQDKADKLLIEFFGTADVSDMILVKAYSAVKDYKRLAKVWEAFVKGDSLNVEYRKSLAGAYLLLDQKSEAIQALKQAAQAIPSFKQEAEYYIGQIETGK